MIIYYGGTDDREANREYEFEGCIWVDHLREIDDEVDVLVLFSEPTSEDFNFIQKMNMDRVIAHEGIHLECKTFRTREILHQLIARVLDDKKARRIQRYIEQLENLDFEEKEYLGHAYRLKMQEASSNHKMRDYSGKLLTYRGENELFKSIVKAIAADNKGSRILLVDGDLLRPSFDEIFGIRHVSSRYPGYVTGKDNTGLNIALELLKRKASLDEILQKTTIRPPSFLLKRLSDKLLRRCRIEILLGNYNIYNYENYHLNSLQTLISAMLQRFDWVIVKLSDALHDEFAMSMTHRGDLNLIALRDRKSEIRYYAQVYEMLAVRQDIDRNKICVLKGYSYPDAICSHLFKQSYKGNIRKVGSIVRRLS